MHRTDRGAYDDGRTRGASDERMRPPRVLGIVDVMTGTTTTPTTTAPRAPADARVVRLPLSPRVRKLVLLVHIAAAGVWLGLDLVLGILVFTALGADPTGAGAAAASLAAVATWPIVVVGVVTLVSGILLGLGSKYGLVRYWWVLVKLVINIVLVTLVVLVLWPGLASLGEAGRAALASGDSPVVGATLVFPPVVSSTVVIVAMTLSVFKPWGRVRRSR
ncbi:hypothetical protein [Agromyces bauzanensis]